MQSSDPSVISSTGIHWHPILTIYVGDEKQKLPVDLGIGPQYSSLPSYDPSMGMTQIHTHEDADEGVIHLEFAGIVRGEDITLGRFLEIWDKDTNSFGDNVSMTVNGEENAELENYVMRDGDQIELRYE